MNRLVALIRGEPALVAALVLAVIQAGALPDAWQKVVMALLSLLAGTVVRSQVTPVVKLVGLADDPAVPQADN